MSEHGRKIGDVVTEKIVVTEEMVMLFAKASGDFNPIHVDEEYAKNTRFGKRIAHGMMSAALISRVLAMKLGLGGVYLSQSLKFLKPIFLEEEVTVTLTVLKLREDRGIAVVETNITKQNGETCVKGEATIMFGEKVK